MDRSEKIGLGVAVVGHVLLFGALSLGFLGAPELPKKIEQQPIDVSLVPDVALEATAPQSVETPAESIAPDEGAPEDAAPPAPEEAEPEPKPDPVPPAPQPKPATETCAQAATGTRAEASAQTQARAAETRRKARAGPEARREATAQGREGATRQGRAREVRADQGRGETERRAREDVVFRVVGQARQAVLDQGQRLDRRGQDLAATRVAARRQFPEGSVGRSVAEQVGSAQGGQARRAGGGEHRLGDPAAGAALRQPPGHAGPGAERIRVTINLKLNRDGTLKSRPTISGHAGVDDDNRRYVDRVDDLAIATFVGCSPLRGLPDDLYDVQNGWSNFSLRYKLPG